MDREQAIQMIFDRHGRCAVYVFATGYISRTAYRVLGGKGIALYMQGSMGMGPAIGLGMALNTNREIVVVNGDGALLMSLGTTHTLRTHKSPNLFHYVLDNGCYESVGGQPCHPLESSYPGVDEIFKIGCSGKDDRVGISVEYNADSVRRYVCYGCY